MASFDTAVPPGGEGKITLKVKTEGYQGAVRKSARVTTNDPEKENVALVIKATVQVPIDVSSRYVYLYSSGDQPVRKTVDIKAELEKPLSLTVDEFTLQNKLKYDIETVEKGKVYRIRFTSIPDVKESFRGILKLKTNYPEKPEITLVVNGRFKPAKVSAKPSSKGIGQKSVERENKVQEPSIYVSSRYIRLYGKEGTEITKSVDIRAESNKSLNLTISEFSLKDKLKYTVETLEKGQKYRIRFSTIPGENHNFNGILKLKTNYPEMPLITFVIHGRFNKN